MYRPSFSEEAAPTWGAASSPSPAAAVGRHRTPCDDAPAYDPLLWKDTDNSYISTLATHVMTHQPPTTPGFGPVSGGKPAKPPLQAFLSSSWAQSPEEEAAARLSKFHAVYDRKPTTWLGRVLQFVSAKLFPRWHEQLRPADVEALPTRDLIHLMQLALAAGEIDRSAMLARELSRRKLALHMQAFPARDPNIGSGNGGGGGRETGVRVERAAAPPSPASPLPQPASAADYDGFLPRRESPQMQPQRPVRSWADSLGVPSGRAPSWSPPRRELSAHSTRDYSADGMPISVERTAPWGGEAVHQSSSQPSAMAPEASAATSSYTNDIGLSSLRGSETGSRWPSESRWSGQWPLSPL